MTAMRKRASFVRLLALIAVLSLVAAACTSEGTPETTADGGTDTTAAPTETTSPPDTTAPGDTTDTTAAPSPGSDLDTYTMGIFADVTTDNYWNAADSTGATVWNSYLLDPTRVTLYTLQYPGIEMAPALAADEELPAPTQDGDTWVAEVTLREAQWSDGSPITAGDVAFTYNTAVEFELGGNWPDFVDTDLITSVEAADDSTVRVTFNAEPGLAVWGTGTGVPFMPIMPESFWGPVVEEARGSDAPAEALRAASGAGEPAGGSTIFVERQEGSFAASEANPNYYGTGDTIESGGITYEDGPFAQNFQFNLYGGQDQAVLALGEGETDFLLNPLGMQRGLQDQVANNPDLTAVVNPTNGFRYMAFNLTRAPMSDLAFRQALAVVTDKEFVTQNVLQGVAYPVYTMVPEGNEAWYNEEVASEISGSQMAEASTAERVQRAVEILTEAGYTWQTAPEVDAESGTVTSGVGLTDPSGNVIPRIELITPTAAYDPLRAAFGTAIAGFARQIGIDLVSIPTDFNTIIQQVYVPNDAGELDYDMFILGWSLGNPALPTFHESFFASKNQTVINDGNNNTGYENEEFDALVEEFNAATTVEGAYDLMWQMEANLAENLPYVTLFDTGILEFYNNRVQYPFTETLSGLQFQSGMQSTVKSS
jgi:peptide/nickel transport system substrate-binding protein